MQNSALTLSQFQQILGNTIRLNSDLRNVWVQAEMSDVRVVGGHCYMELIEKDAAGTTRAKIRAMIWSGTLAMLRRKFLDTTGRDIATGMKVLVCGSATHHNLYGLSFTISDIDPSYTLGDMERVRREILDRLTREGLIDLNKSLPIPLPPQRIAVVSAPGAAGYGDFMNQISNNPEGFVIYTMLFPAVMQGEKTAPSVLHALDMIEMTSEMWDAVVLIRGGGATTDLNGFDNYELARRIATFPLPVIVGIGHERDRTVLDEIACVRCKTPTAVAAFLIDSMRYAYAEASERVRRIADYCADSLRGEHLRLSSLAQNLPMIVNSRVMRQKLHFSQYANRIGQYISLAMESRRNQVKQLALRLQNDAAKVSQQEKMKLQRLDDMLRLLSPENTLKRGYSITRVNGKAVHDISDIPDNAILETTLLNGQITSQRIEPKT